MESVMVIKIEVFGSCLKEIDVSVELKNGDLLLCCVREYLRFIWEAKAAQNRQLRWVMVPGIGYASKCFLHTLGVIKELKSPCGGRGLVG
jgi:hypothetical protein